ncbi:MAG: hypothetical protein WD601_05295 [Pseudohongiellaceae bacterium]
MENGDFLTAANQAFLSYGGLILVIVIILAVIAAFWLYQNQNSRQQDLQRELQALRFELDDQRMEPRGNSLAPANRSNQGPGLGAAPPPPSSRALGRMHAELELQAYQKIWASVRDLHDKLGTFLRAIETSDSPTESRMAARTAALKAKDCSQRLRPFYPENIEAQVFQLIDNEVHMHLSACAYLDGTKELPTKGSRDQTSSAYQSLRDESKLIYDGECRQQLNALVQSIRHRLANQQVVE